MDGEKNFYMGWRKKTFYCQNVTEGHPMFGFLSCHVLCALVKNLSPSKKKHIFFSARKQLSLGKIGRPSKVDSNRESIVAFIEQPDISYCCPGRKDTVYCGKNNGKSVYRPKHYLLHNMRELVSLYNKDNTKNITYCQMQEIVLSEKHLLNQSKSPEDDCRCETCENGELFLEVVKNYLVKEKLQAFIQNLPADPMELVELGICSVKPQPCMKGEC